MRARRRRGACAASSAMGFGASRPPQSHSPPPHPAPPSRCRRRDWPSFRARRDALALRSGCCGARGDSSMAAARGPAAARTATLPSGTDPGTKLPHRSPRLQPLLLHFLLRFLLRFQPDGNLLLRLLLRDAVGFLDPADELVA